MIRIGHIVKKYPTVTALNDVSLTIERGEFFGLLGPNGAGKSTLMSLLVGYKSPDSGTITVNGQPVTPDNLDVRRQIGLVPQSLALYEDLSAQKNLELFGSFYQLPAARLREIIPEKLNAAQLYDRRRDPVKTFSGGMKRRLNIVASLLHDPQTLLCDEPTVGVDPQSRNAIFDYLLALNAAGITIVYTTHYMEEAERLCKRLAIIDHGKIIALGTVDEMLAKLPYEETVRIHKTPLTIAKLDVFRQFGQLIDQEEDFELRPTAGFKLSAFFAGLEANAIPYSLVELHRPTLEALFLHLTGRSLRE